MPIFIIIIIPGIYYFILKFLNPIWIWFITGERPKYYLKNLNGQKQNTIGHLAHAATNMKRVQ